MNLFVLVSTGQKVANLPPVFEHAAPGDHVLWVESNEARQRDWTTTPRALLEDRGLVTTDTVPVPQVNDPVALADSLRPFADQLRGQYEVVYLVANGGTKLSPVGLLRGLEPLAPRLLYGDEKPAVHSRYPHGLDAAPDVRPYTLTPAPSDRPRLPPLDLPDVLRLNGFTFATGSGHVRVWPDALPAPHQQERYGADEPYTYGLHAAHHAWACVPPADQRVPFGALPGFPELQADLRRWNTAVQQIRKTLNPQTQAGLYNSTLNLADAARRPAAARSAGVPQPPVRIGDALERAVSRRVRAWVDLTGHPGVRSVWAGVEVSRETSAHRCDAEFDVLLVLTNGVLVHLECKSAEVSYRDLDVGAHRLRQAASQLARLAVVLPVFTRAAGEPWFAPLHARRVELEERLGAGSVLPFTLQGQPGVYAVTGTALSGPPAPEHGRNGSGDENGRGGLSPAGGVPCRPFEEALGGLLAEYRP